MNGMRRYMPWWDDCILRWGKAEFLLHDDGWWIAWDQVIRVQGRWPRWGFWRKFQHRRKGP